MAAQFLRQMHLPKAGFEMIVQRFVLLCHGSAVAAMCAFSSALPDVWGGWFTLFLTQKTDLVFALASCLLILLI